MIPLPAADAARHALRALGFRVTEDEATLCFVARDARDRRVDVPTAVSDKEDGAPNARKTARFGATRRKASLGSG